MNGGIIDGVHRDSVSFVRLGLRKRFGQFDEETKMAIMSEYLAFDRRPNESINMILSRYELIRMRARNEGMFVMSIQGCVL